MNKEPRHENAALYKNEVVTVTLKLNQFSKPKFSLKDVYFMARKNNTHANTTANPCGATATISGTLKEVYEGKKYDYATIRVDHDYDEYYDLFKVACSKDFILPDDGEFITLNCVMKNYKGEITFKEVNADTQ